LCGRTPARRKLGEQPAFRGTAVFFFRNRFGAPRTRRETKPSFRRARRRRRRASQVSARLPGCCPRSSPGAWR
jgi:hypothetical protein